MPMHTFPWRVVLAPDKRIREEGTPTKVEEQGTRERKEGGGGGGAKASRPEVDDGRDGPEGSD